MSDKPVSSPARTERAAYRTPKLVRYGKLASLVQGGTIPFDFEDVNFFFVSNIS